jgi:hypothetical protein
VVFEDLKVQLFFRVILANARYEKSSFLSVEESNGNKNQRRHSAYHRKLPSNRESQVNLGKKEKANHLTSTSRNSAEDRGKVILQSGVVCHGEEELVSDGIEDLLHELG